MSAGVASAAVVIGAASGMGEAVATLFAEEGRRVILADRSAPRLEALARKLGAEAVACDITETASVEHLAETAGDTSALVVTAGLSPTMGTFDQIMEVNLIGTARVLRVFEPKVGRGSAVVCFASIAAHMAGAPGPELLAAVDDTDHPELVARVKAAAGSDDPGGAYTYSKLGVLRLARRTGAAWGHRGARVYSLCPGIIDTPMGKREYDAQPFMAEMIKMTPLERQGKASEIASVVGFLCSDGASYMAGCDVLVDGGFVAATTSGILA